MTSPADAPNTIRPAAPHAPHGDHIDRSQETYRPSPYASRVIPPSGDVSPDGSRPWPQPSLASRILVWGGLVAGAAAATAGTVLAVRAVVDGVSGTDEDDAVEAARQRARADARSGNKRPAGPAVPRNAFAASGAARRPAADQQPRPSPRGEAGLAPRFAELPEEQRQAIRERAEARQEAERERAARARARARRGADPARYQPGGKTGAFGMISGLNRSITDVTTGLRDAVGTVTAAIEGFRSVAGQAGSIMDEFRSAADTVRTMFDGADDRSAQSGRPEARSNPDGRGAAPQRGTSRRDTMVDLRGDPTARDADRTHRL